MTQRRSPLGPWLKVYVSALDTKAHYTDAQFRALIEVWMHAVRQPSRGLFANRSAIDRKVGSPNVDFLIEQGDLELFANGSVAVHKWSTYQAGVLSTERGSRSEEDGGQVVDNSSGTVREHSLSRDARDAGLPSPLLEEPSTTKEDHPVVDGADFDALDRFYELTQIRPWDKRVGQWLRDLQTRHGISNVVAALEVENRDNPGARDLVGKVAARLERQADRVAAAKRSEPKKVDPLQAQIRAAVAAQEGSGPLVEALGDPEEGRKAFEALRGSLGRRGGSLTPVSAVVSSLQNGSTGNGQSLTVGKGSGRESTAAAARASLNTDAAPSPGRETVRLNVRAEPGESEPNRSEASTDEAND